MPLKLISPGTRFAKIIVGAHIGYDHRRRAIYDCLCDCGNRKEIAGSSLRAEEVKSCGCLPAERMKTLSSLLASDETGKRYGKLTVLKRAGRAKSGCYLYECRCDCGQICSVQSSSLRNGNRTSCTAWACREDFSEVLKEVEEPSPNSVKDAYFAGHFDGEGCVSFQGENYFPHLTIRVGICYKPTLLEYQEAFGGVIKRVGPRRENDRVQWCWQLSAQHEVFRFICRILPYSTEKQSQLQLAKDYMLQRIKSEKYNATPEFIQQIPTIRAQMSEMKRFEYAN